MCDVWCVTDVESYAGHCRTVAFREVDTLDFGAEIKRLTDAVAGRVSINFLWAGSYPG